MKTRFFLMRGLCIVIIFFVSFIFNGLNANRSWILFDPQDHSQVCYVYNTNVYVSDLNKGAKSPVFRFDEKYLRKRFSDIAMSSDDYLWAVGRDAERDYLLQCLSNEYTYCDEFNEDHRRFFISAKMNMVVTVTDDGSKLKLINTSTKEECYLPKTLEDLSFEKLETVDMADDGSVVVFSITCRIWVWHPYKSEVYDVSADLGGEHFSGFAISPDGKRLCTVSRPRGAELWNIQDNVLEKVFRWNNSDEDFRLYTCPPKIEGWVLDRKIYYQKTPDFLFPKAKADRFWCDISHVVFSSDSNLIYMLTQKRGFWGDRVEWALNVYNIDDKVFINNIPLPQLKGYPRNIAASPDGMFFIILNQDGSLLRIPLKS